MNEAIHEIKTQLWRFGFGVEDHSGIAGYNLQVNKKWRVKVIQSQKVERVTTSGCDVVAIYTGGKRPNKFYSIGEKTNSDSFLIFDTWTKSPTKIFK